MIAETSHSVFRSHQETQAIYILELDIKISIDIPYLEESSENLWRIFRFHEIRSTFYTGSTLRKLLCKPKDWVATEYKNNIVYEISCASCEVVFFDDPERSLKSLSDKHKRSFRNCDLEKDGIVKHCWEADHNFSSDQKKVFDFESRSISETIKETIGSLKNLNQINKISNKTSWNMAS